MLVNLVVCSPILGNGQESTVRRVPGMAKVVFLLRAKPEALPPLILVSRSFSKLDTSEAT